MKQLFLVLIAGFSLGSVAAQEFQIPWFSIDGGGGTGSGGSFLLHGTIGQPDAGVLQGGIYQVVGGFWGVIGALPSSDVPALRIEHQSGPVTISWTSGAPGFVLQETINLTTPSNWNDVAGAMQSGSEFSYRVPLAVGTRFFRLRRTVGE